MKGITMTAEQRAALARDHLEKAAELIEKLAMAGAPQLDGAKENLSDVIGLLDDLNFEEGNLIAATEPAMVSLEEDESDLADLQEFREDQEEE